MRTSPVLGVALLVAVALLALISTDGTAAPAVPSATEVIDKYEQAIKRFERCRFKATVNTTTESPSVPRGTHSIQSQFSDVVMDSPSRLRMSIALTVSRQENGKWSKDEQAMEYTVIGNTRKQISWRSDKPKEKYVNVRLDCVTPEERVRDTFSNEFSVVMHGYLGRNFLYTLLRQGNPSVSSVRVNNIDAIRVDSRTVWGKLTIWLDPGRGYLPRRVQQIKDTKDLVEANLTIEAAKWKGEFAGVDSNKVGIDFTVDVDYSPPSDTKSGHDIRDLRIESVETDRYASGETRTTTSKTHVYDLDYSQQPPQAFDLTTPVPDKTHVDVENHENLAYEWRGGEIVKTGVIEPVGDLRPQPRKWWRWVVGSAAGAAAIAVAWVVYNRIRRRPEAA